MILSPQKWSCPSKIVFPIYSKNVVFFQKNCWIFKKLIKIETSDKLKFLSIINKIKLIDKDRSLSLFLTALSWTPTKKPRANFVISLYSIAITILTWFFFEVPTIITNTVLYSLRPLLLDCFISVITEVLHSLGPLLLDCFSSVITDFSVPPCGPNLTISRTSRYDLYHEFTVVLQHSLSYPFFISA